MNELNIGKAARDYHEEQGDVPTACAFQAGAKWAIDEMNRRTPAPAAVSAEPERLIRAFCEGARFAWEYFPGELGSEYDAEEVEREARTLARSNELAITPAPANVCPLPQVKCSGEEAPVGTFTCPPSCRAKEVEK
jgi:hypothetical protein